MNEIEEYLIDISNSFGPTRYISMLKSGKEANVHLIKVENTLAALKIYKKNTKFSSRNQYMSIEEVDDKRLIRAVNKKTNVGVRVVKNMWVDREFTILKTLYEYGAYVPEPYYKFKDAIVMEYLGDIRNPSPRLSDIDISKINTNRYYNIIIDHIKLFNRLGFAHGDLSKYNILVYNDNPYIIDFPQVVYKSNPNYHRANNRDINNIEGIFIQ